MIEFNASGFFIDEELLSTIASELKERLPKIFESAKRNTYLKDHVEILERSIDRYVAGDYISCNHILFPRIEGIMRTYHLDAKNESGTSDFIESLISVGGKELNKNSLLLADRFETYLRDIYLSRYDPDKPIKKVSRHSVAHGQAAAELLNLKSATVALLSFLQLNCFLR